ncbi:MAG: hypothetical protein LBR74_05140 [Eubacterium sp.]|jgi:hypothetical protein|nr:hypothetical protein [Eubacterium sp.]
MYKRSDRLKAQDEKMKKLIRRNWIIMAVSLILAFFCYFFLDEVIAIFKR